MRDANAPEALRARLIVGQGGAAASQPRYFSGMPGTTSRARAPRWGLRLLLAVALGGALGAAGGVAAVNRLEPGHPGGIDSLSIRTAPASAATDTTGAAPPRPAPAAAKPAVADSSAADPLALDPATVDSLARLDSLAAADSAAVPDTLRHLPSPPPTAP